MCVCVDASIHAYVRTYLRMYMHASMHTCTHAHRAAIRLEWEEDLQEQMNGPSEEDWELENMFCGADVMPEQPESMDPEEAKR